MSQYKKTTVCCKCGEPYIKDFLLCKCTDMGNHSFKLRRKQDFALELVLRDIRDNMDIQIDRKKAQISQLKRDLADMKAQNPPDQWEQYLAINDETARARIYDNNCRLVAVEAYDRIAAEG